VIWHAAYREPHESKRANEAELGYIASGGGLAAQGNRFVLSWAAVRTLLSTRQILGASIGQFCGNSTLVFFLTWFPSYLATERGMDWLRSGFAASLPYIAASVGVLVGGAVSDEIIRRTGCDAIEVRAHRVLIADRGYRPVAGNTDVRTLIWLEIVGHGGQYWLNCGYKGDKVGRSS